MDMPRQDVAKIGNFISLQHFICITVALYLHNDQETGPYRLTLLATRSKRTISYNIVTHDTNCDAPKKRKKSHSAKY